MQGKLEAGLEKAALHFKMPASPMLTAAVVKHAKKIMKERLLICHMPARVIGMTEGILENLNFFMASPFCCAAYIPSSRILEVGIFSAA